MIEPQNYKDASARIVAILNKVVPILWEGKKNRPEIKIEVQDGDPFICLDGGIYITPVLTERINRGILAKKKKKTGIFDMMYQLQVATYDPGVRYYKDGSGQPPSEDIEDVGEPIGNAYIAVQRALDMIWKQRLDGLMESVSMAEQEEDEKALWAEEERLRKPHVDNP
jgi:hypothetical protein